MLAVLHGPNTQAHVSGFTRDEVVQELKRKCPRMYELFQEVARTQRTVAEDASVLPLPELKVVMSMCTLLNARSKGVQLLISLMLVARATNKQVHKA